MDKIIIAIRMEIIKDNWMVKIAKVTISQSISIQNMDIENTGNYNTSIQDYVYQHWIFIAIFIQIQWSWNDRDTITES